MKTRSASDRLAFTLIESLVVMAIISVLAVLAIVAIQKARASADRATCVNNMHQIGMAALQYHDDFGSMPPACSMAYATQCAKPSITDTSGLPPIELLNDSAARKAGDPAYPFGPNWAVHLLPYTGESIMFENARINDYFANCPPGDAFALTDVTSQVVNAGAGGATGNVNQIQSGLQGALQNLGNAGPGVQQALTNAQNSSQYDPVLRDRWRTVVQNQRIKLYTCPADGGNRKPFSGFPNAPGDWARGNYAANAGPGWWSMSLNGQSYEEAYGLTGPVMGINWGTRLCDIKDGTSKTVMFNEVRAGVCGLDSRGTWAMGLPGASVTAANAIADCTGPNNMDDGADEIQDGPKFWYQGIGTRDGMGVSKGIANMGFPSWQAQARSQHTGGVNACFADGSVHFIHNTIAQSVWFSLLSTNDGGKYAPGTPLPAPDLPGEWGEHTFD